MQSKRSIESQELQLKAISPRRVGHGMHAQIATVPDKRRKDSKIGTRFL